MRELKRISPGRLLLAHVASLANLDAVQETPHDRPTIRTVVVSSLLPRDVVEPEVEVTVLRQNLQGGPRVDPGLACKQNTPSVQ